ncbi:efflux RND transporter periplasmic adaptor subunit [Sphingopyxis panaciterrulae]|uniref:RND family efflux transporter MFP subunit n=1 Tax=Sphingopyxis panaciterrulae TaxID=462372 RepID=A0A7W9EPJ4_9SPHN|nr:efflux RND transporter periplasmic adaptor subunit [Sphingopyxis panaciterrulae]MBB5705612.1 RND family efflux transporter MFP subunit [Sphingopyxis panaciterrulae]
MNMLSPIRREEAAKTAPAPAPSPRRWRRTLQIGLPLAILVAAGYALTHREGPANAAPPMPVVTVAAPLVREITEWDDYVGRFEASRSVDVRPRVSGELTGIHFTDGQVVRKGQLLFTIDPRPFNAALAEARADAASARSKLALARTNLARAERLIVDDAISQSDVDQLGAEVRAATAALAAAEARVRSRALDVEFTRVRAPIGGRISDRRVDAGNLVAAGEGAGSTLLTTINALDPIYFAFDSSEALFLKAQRDREAGGTTGQQVEVRLQDESNYRWKGRVDFTDNAINAHSGTMRVRAVIDNPDYFLTPGMFGNMRLAQGGKVSALLVPDAAVRTDQARKQLFVVAKDGTVAARPVETGPLVAGLRVIRSGLTAQDRVVVQGIQFAQPGTKVTAKPTTIRPKTAPATTQVGERQSRAASQATLAG